LCSESNRGSVAFQSYKSLACVLPNHFVRILVFPDSEKTG
jgi:hypothetical protein